jgi:hypothetical protein
MIATNDIFSALNLRISFSCFTADKAFLFRLHGRHTLESLSLQDRVLAQIPIGVRIRRELGMSSLSLQQAQTTFRAELLAASVLCDSGKLQRARGTDARAQAGKVS